MPEAVVSHPAHNVSRTSPYGAILVETSRTIIVENNENDVLKISR